MGCERHFPAWLLSSREEGGRSSSQDKGATGGRWELWEASWNHRAQVGALGNKSELQGVRWKPHEAGGSPREQVEAPREQVGDMGDKAGVSEDGWAGSTVSVTHS